MSDQVDESIAPAQNPKPPCHQQCQDKNERHSRQSTISSADHDPNGNRSDRDRGFFDEKDRSVNFDAAIRKAKLPTGLFDKILNFNDGIEIVEDQQKRQN